jgi:hypothetical protein
MVSNKRLKELPMSVSIMKVGDLVRSTGPSAPDIAIIFEIINKWHIKIMWIDTGEFDAGAKSLFEVISESE